MWEPHLATLNLCCGFHKLQVYGVTVVRGMLLESIIEPGVISPAWRPSGVKRITTV